MATACRMVMNPTWIVVVLARPIVPPDKGVVIPVTARRGFAVLNNVLKQPAMTVCTMAMKPPWIAERIASPAPMATHA